MKRTSLGLLVAGISLAGTLTLLWSCKERGTYATAYADNQSEADRRWNGRQCFFGSSLGSLKRLPYVSAVTRYDVAANDRGFWNGRDWLKPAVLEGIKQLTGQQYNNVDEAISQVDDKTIYYSPLKNYLTAEQFPITPVNPDLTPIESRFFLIEASMGDNWTGFVIQADLIAGRNDNRDRPFKIVNLYSDGDSYNCAVPRPTADQRRNAMVPERLCAFGEDSGYLASSMARRNGVWRAAAAYKTLTATSNFTENQRREIIEGLRNDANDSSSIADLINSTDDEEVGYQEIKYTKNNKVYRWYSYYGGDNPMGFIFGEDASGNVRRMAEIGDGSIGNCYLKKIR